MSVRASDSVPLSARGFLLTLVMCLHVAGATALSRLPVLPQHDEEPTVLRASWIENLPSASSLLPSSPSMQPAEPLPVAHPASPPPRTVQAPEHRTSRESPTPSQPQTAAVQSAPIPAAVDAPSAVPADLSAVDDSIPDLRTGVSAAVAGSNETAGGKEEGRDREGGWGKDYVGPDFNVAYFSNPEPEYPSMSRRLREQGLVKLRVHVTVEGRADEVTLHRSSGYGRLDKAALDAVKRWRFQPARRAGTPVAGWVVVPVRFELQS